MKKHLEECLVRFWDEVRTKGLNYVHTGHPELDELIKVTIAYSYYYQEKELNVRT